MEGIEQAVAGLERARIDYVRQEPMKAHTTFEIGGPAAVYCTPVGAAAVADAIAVARRTGLPWFILGKGSNVLFCDEGYPGVVIHPVMEAVAVEGSRVRAGAGATLGAVCEAARDSALTGLEFAWGIPGSVGGAVYMNAGAFDGEMLQVLESVTVLDEEGVLKTLPVGALELAYRDSIFHRRHWCIVDATIALRAGDPGEIARLMTEHLAHRTEKQPLDLPSAGSAFKRPNGAYASQLIDRCGLRGHRVGGAAIDQKHCGFIVNLGGATCADVLALAGEVKARVLSQTGYALEMEIRVVGGGLEP